MKNLHKYFIVIGILFSGFIAIGQSDGCSLATPIGVTANCSAPTAGTTTGATQTIPGCVGNADDDVWYQFVATSTSQQIDVVGSASFDAVVQLFSGSCSTLISLTCQDATLDGGTETIFATGLTIGATYRIRVYDYYAGSGSGSFTICVIPGPTAPSNDFCANAIPLAVNGVCSATTGTSLGATQTMVGCAGTADDDVWFSFVATNSVQTITVVPSGSLDAVVQLLDGACITFNSLYCIDDTWGGNEVINAVGLSPGTTYYIRVYDYWANTGGDAFDICVTGTATAAPVNDEPCSAIALPQVTAACQYLDFTSFGATASLGAPTPASCVGGSAPQEGGFTGASADVWFTITVPSTGVVEIMPDPASGIGDIVMSLYSGTCGSLTQIACADDHTYPWSPPTSTPNTLKPHILETGLTPGDVLYLRVWKFGAAAILPADAEFGLCVTSPTNDDCANALYICDINGYSSSTSAAYTADRPSNMFGNNELFDGTSQANGINTGGPFGGAIFDVEINNNSWIMFTASATTATLTVSIYDCWKDPFPLGGIQMEVFEGTNCTNFISVSNFEENSTGFVITATGLTVGQNYYLMVDGYAGDICSYTITADSGVQFPEIAPVNPICAGSSVTLNGPSGATSYSWYPGGQTTQSITVSPSTTTTYTCIVEGVCDYKQTLTRTVTVNQLPTMTSTTTPAAICSGDLFSLGLISDIASGYIWTVTPNANVTGEISGGGSPISNTLFNTTGSNQTVVYSVVPTASSSGCIGNAQTVSVTVNPNPTVVANINTATTVCQGTAVTLTGSGATSYTWTGGVTNGTPFTPGVGTVNYTVTGTDGNSCTNTDVVGVTVNSLPNVVANATGTSICVGDQVTLTGAGATSYSWTGGVTNGTPFTPGVGTVNYTVTGTDGNSCTNTDVVGVTVNSLPNVVANATNTSLCVGNSVTLTGAGATSYTWDNGVTNNTPFSPAVGAVTYTVSGTDGNSCVNTDQVSVTVNGLPTVTASSTAASICDGEIVTLTGGGATSYTWSNGVTNGVAFTPGSTGNTTYTVTGTDGNSCQNTNTVDVFVNTLPTVVANATNTGLCNGASVTLTGSGATSYTWDNGVTNNTPFTPAVGSITYTVTGTDGNSCVNTDQVSVVVNALPTVVANATGTTICVGNSVTLTGGGATFYIWDNGVTDNVPFTPTVGSVTYTVTGTDGNNCTDTDQVTVNVNPMDDPSFNYPLGNAYCASGTDPIANVTGLVGGTFSIDNGGTINTSNGTIDLDVSGIGNYTVTYLTGGACPNSTPVVIDITGAPDATFNYLATPYCQIGTATINVGASQGVFTSTGGLVFVDVNTGEIDLAASTPNTYTITNEINVPGCAISIETATIEIVPLPTVTALSSSLDICDGGTVTLTGGGAISYTWDNGVADGVAFTPGSTGNTTYTVTGTDGNSCQNTNTIDVFVNVLPTVAANTTNTSLCNGATVTLTGGGATSYTWDNGVVDNIPFSPAIGPITYTVTGTDGNNCVNTDAISVVVNALPTVVANATGTTICNGDPITLTGSGATTYVWTGGVSDGIAFNPSATTTYTVTGTDGNNCDNTSQVTVIVTPTEDSSFNYSGLTFCASGTNPIPVITGVQGGTFSSSNGAVFVNPIVNPGEIDLATSGIGTFDVTYTTPGTCSSSMTVSIIITTAPIAGFNYSGTETYCQIGTETPIFDAGASGGAFTSTPNGLTIDAISGAIDLVNSSPGTYTITNDINIAGCAQAIETTVVTVNPPDNDGFIYSASSYCTSASPQTPTIDVAGGTFTSTPVGLSIDAGGVIDVANSTIGSYDITYDMNLQCQNDSTVSVTISGQLDATIIPPVSGTSMCETDASVILTTIDGGGIWSGTGVNATTGEFDPAIAGPGTHTIIYEIMDPSCGDLQTLDIVVNLTPVVSVVGATVCDGSAPVLIATGTGGNINWYSDAGLLNIVATGTNTYSPILTEGIYTYYVLDSLNGCISTIDSANANVFDVTASFTATPESGNVPLIVDYTNTSIVVDIVNDQFNWDFGNGNTSTDFEPSNTYSEPGTFTTTLTVTNEENMCSDTYSVVISVNGEYTIEVPNIFTPDGNGQNDTFFITSTNVTELKVTIFDRWGLLMFGWEGIAGGWDGRTKAGIEASEGTYYYIIELTDYKGEVHTLQGPFNLNR